MSRLSESRHPAYHLRPNKAVDRFVFLELLRSLELRCSLRQHVYVALGGPFLEDFRLLSQHFPQMALICVEQDRETVKRQRFHMCSRKMQCIHSSLGDFIATRYPTSKPTIVWADYTDVNRECFAEVGDIARKALPHSLLRITFPAESPVLGLGEYAHRYPPEVPKAKKAAFDDIRRSYEDDMAVDGIVFRPDWFQWSDFSPKKFPRLLARMLRAVVEGSSTFPRVFLPLHTVKYSDGTIMLSMTGLICRAEERDLFAKHFNDHFAFYSPNCDEVDVIDVPTLTTKERLHLDRILPTVAATGEKCVKRLGYLIEGDDSEGASRRKLQQFEKYYRLYPYFGKLVP